MKKYFIILLLILFSSVVYSNPNCFQEGCTDINLAGGQGKILYGSNTPNSLQAENVSYEKCSIPPGIFNPVATDIDLDGLMDIILVTADGGGTSQISIYDMDCNLKYLIEPPAGTIRTAPVITNWDHDEYQEITVLLTTTLKVYEFNPATEVMDQVTSFASVGFSSIYHWACDRDGDGCTAFSVISNNTGFYNVTSESFVLNLAQVRVIPQSSALIDYDTGLTITDMGVSGKLLPMCTSNSTTGTCYVSCQLFDETGIDQGVYFDVQPSSAVCENGGINSVSSHIARIGSIYRWFTKVNTDTVGSDAQGVYLHTIGGTQLVSDTSNSIELTNWVVADYTKSGSNIGCYRDRVSPSSSTLHCYDQDTTLTNYIYGNNDDSLGPGIVAGDFYSNYTDQLGIADIYGIGYTNGSDITYEYTTGLSYDSNKRGFEMVVSSRGTSLAYVYNDYPNTLAFIVRDVATTLSCGNGICDTFETGFTCPEDCVGIDLGINETGAFCTSNDQCDTGLCEYGFCVLLPAKYECTSDDQCLSGVCSNNRCTLPSYWNRVDASKKQQYGDDTNTNNFISLFFMILVPLLIIFYGRCFSAVLVGLGVFYGFAIFFAMVGWLSPFLLLGFIIVGLLSGTFLLLLGRGE